MCVRACVCMCVCVKNTTTLQKSTVKLINCSLWVLPVIRASCPYIQCCKNYALMVSGNYIQLWRNVLLLFLQGTNQHDVQELNRILFSALEHSLVGTSGSTFIQQLYHGTIVNSIVCKDCGSISQRQVCVCLIWNSHRLIKTKLILFNLCI